MPVVRVEQTQQAAPLPGARRQAAENDISAGVALADQRARTDLAAAGLGATVAGAGIQLAREQRAAMERERERADQIAVMNAGNVLSAWENQALYDPNTGALTVKGKDAFGLPEKVGDQFQQVASQVEASMQTPRQKEAFTRLKLERQQNLDLTLRRHVYGEMQRYEGQELQATVENARSAAIANAGDPRRVGLELGRAVDAIRTHAPRLGLGPEEVKQQVEATTSATHVGVIEQLLATDQTKMASVYFDETKSQIKGESLARIEKAIETGKNLAESQKEADKIIAEGGSLTAQLEKAKGLDPKLRDEVSARLEHNDAVKERAKREDEASTLRGVYDILDKTHDPARIPAPVWAQMDGAQRSAARSYAEHLARGVAVETDFPTYYNLMQKAAHDPETFATENLLNYRAKIGDTELKQLTEMQASIVKGDRNAANKQSGNFLTHEQIINKSLALYGLDPAAKPNTAQGKANAELYRLTAQGVAVIESKLKPGQHATEQDIQSVVDHILSTSEKTPGSWWGLIPFTGTSFFSREQPIINVTAKDIPPAQRTIIEDQLRRAGRAVSDATVLEAYQAMRVRPR